MSLSDNIAFMRRPRADFRRYARCIKTREPVAVDGKTGWWRVVKVTGEGERCRVACVRMTAEETAAIFGNESGGA